MGKAVALSWGQFCLPPSTWQCLKTSLIATPGKSYGHPLGRDQACCKTSHNAWVRPPPTHLPDITALRLRSSRVDGVRVTSGDLKAPSDSQSTGLMEARSGKGN